MSRSGYSDDYDDRWACIRWQGAVKAAIRGKRGQAFFREMLAALDAMPDKKLHAHVLAKGPDGPACAMGVVVQARGLDVTELEARIEKDDIDDVGRETAKVLDIPYSLACEIAYMNDEAFGYGYSCKEYTPEQRWQAMRDWIVSQIKDEVPA